MGIVIIQVGLTLTKHKGDYIVQCVTQLALIIRVHQILAKLFALKP
jgi:hypothetical protein